MADEPDDSNQPLRTDDLFTPRRPGPDRVRRFWVNPSCPYPLMPAAPLLQLYQKVVEEEWRAWDREWGGPLSGPARQMERLRSLGGNRLQTWDIRHGWMLDYGPLDPFRWAFYWRFWAGRSAVVAEWQTKIDEEFAKFEKLRDRPTGGWNIGYLVQLLGGAYACVDYSDWAHARVPMNRVALAAWVAEKEARRRPMKLPNLYGPRLPDLPKGPGQR
jgi:hypothetical protein